MYDTAKKAREAMKSKAKRLAGEKNEKVDSSDWSPAEPLNTDVKTGMRPVSRRAYKSGGKVMGEACAPRNDRKPRKSGGVAKAKKEMAEEKSEAAEYAKAKTNRDVKAANQEREGIKHIGGLKTGGRAKKQHGGPNGSDDPIGDLIRRDTTPVPAPDRRPLTPAEAGIRPGPGTYETEREENAAAANEQQRRHGRSQPQNRKSGGRAKRASGGATSLAGQKKVEEYQADLSKPKRGKAENYKKGGRAKGGPVAGAEEMMRSAAETSGVPSSTMSFTNVKKGMLSPLRGAKKGGRIKKMGGGDLMGGALSGLATKNAFDTGNPFSTIGLVKGLMGKDKDEGKKAGGRIARKSGGRAKSSKGGTKINIMIAAGKPAGPSDMMPPPGPMGGPPPGLPIPMPGADGGAPPPMPMPMPMPAPAAGGTPPMGMPAGLPMPRKSGGRVTKVAKSYKDMEAGSGGGEGRLQKTDIAKTGKGAPTYKRGGKVYRSYKDMDAGAGSGEGRLEKTEIQKRKA